ncbi:MAG: hypothetical protein AAB723_04385 [Patescibacteria group bacterium]
MPQTKAKNKQSAAPSQEELAIANLEFYARKLAFLLSASTMPEQVKQGWLALLPEMTPEQIERFIDILEAKFLNEATTFVDKKYEKQLQDIFSRYAKEDAKREKSLLKKINALNKKLK